MNNAISYENIQVDDFIEGVILETFKEPRISRPRVRPVHPDLKGMKVVFPKHLREDHPIGTRFRGNVKVSQKHDSAGQPHGNPYLFCYSNSIELIPD